MIETTSWGIATLIVLMALVTLVTRFGGVYLMSFVRLNPRVEGFINAMASTVLIAIVVPLAFDGDWAARMALLVTAGVMLVTQKPLPAIASGVIVTALIRYIF